MEVMKFIELENKLFNVMKILDDEICFPYIQTINSNFEVTVVILAKEGPDRIDTFEKLQHYTNQCFDRIEILSDEIKGTNEFEELCLFIKTNYVCVIQGYIKNYVYKDKLDLAHKMKKYKTNIGHLGLDTYKL